MASYSKTCAGEPYYTYRDTAGAAECEQHSCTCRSFAKDVAPQVNDMIKWARDEHIPVIYTLHGADQWTSVLRLM